MVHDQRFMVAKSAVGQAEHYAVAESIDLLTRIGFGDARHGLCARADLAERSNRDQGWTRESGFCRILEVGVELKKFQMARVGQADKIIGTARGWQSAAIKVCRQQTRHRRRLLKTNRVCRPSRQH